MFQVMIARVNGVAFGDEHNPKAVSQIMLVTTHNFSQTAPDTVTSNCASNATRSDEADAARPGTLHWRKIEHQEFAASRRAAVFYVIKLCEVRQAPMFWKRERTCPCHGCGHLAPGTYKGGLLPELRNKTSQKKKYAAEVISLAAVSRLASLPLEIGFS
jgi:hypothetical protein